MKAWVEKVSRSVDEVHDGPPNANIRTADLTKYIHRIMTNNI